jgi:hypothetical protein
MRSRRSGYRDGWLAAALAVGLAAATAASRAEDAAPETAPAPAPVSPEVVPAAATAPAPAPAPAAALAETLQRQDEMIQQLAEQNRKLAEQLDAVTRRLDELKAEKDAAPPAPSGAMPVIPGLNPELEDGVDSSAADAAAPPPRDDTLGRGPTLPSARVAGEKGLVDSVHAGEDYGLKSLFDSIHPKDRKGTPWFEKLTIRGYSQIRFGRGLDQDEFGADPFLLGDRTINGSAENFSIRRARVILFGDLSEHLYLYFQPDFAVPPPGSTSATYFTQLRDLYGDVYIDKEKVNRVRVGLSKVPYGWENMQSSQNRVPLDRTDPINSGVSPNERDIGVFYYWTPKEKQRLLRELVDGGLRGSGNYGILGLGVYNGQGGSQLERDLNLDTVARFTWPMRLAGGQVVEAGVQGYHGHFVPLGAPIAPRGQGRPVTPANTNGTASLEDMRVAGTFVYYPQPFGFQAEWNVGRGPGLNEAQTAVDVRSLQGGYAMSMVKLDTERYGIFTPYVRYQYYRGGYRSLSNAPYGTHSQWDLGVEWQIRREMELTAEYSLVDGINLNAISVADALSYQNFAGGVLRFQFQLNY